MVSVEVMTGNEGAESVKGENGGCGLQNRRKKVGEGSEEECRDRGEIGGAQS